MRMVKVTWIDSCNSNLSWLMIEDIKNWENIEPIRIFTYGALVQEDDNYIVIAQNYGKDPEQCSNLCSIPKGCVESIKDIEEL